MSGTGCAVEVGVAAERRLDVSRDGRALRIRKAVNRVEKAIDGGLCLKRNLLALDRLELALGGAGFAEDEVGAGDFGAGLWMTRVHRQHALEGDTASVTRPVSSAATPRR